MKKVKSTFFAIAILLLTACNSKAQDKTLSTSVTSSVEVIQFHSEHRCQTCLKIETLTKAKLSSDFATVTFKLVNVDDKQNAKLAEKFEATGTALFLYDAKSGRKKDLTEFAFMKAGEEGVFKVELKKYIEDFISTK
jgi:hypothetical protein